jgi:hypothetical protein
MKEIKIVIDKQFIDDCVYQQEWGEVRLDNKELSSNLAKLMKDKTESIIKEVIISVVEDVAKKELKGLIKDKIKAFIIGMADTELFYRDEFRKFLVDIARENKKDIDKKVKAFLESNRLDGKLIEAIGYDMNSRFFNAIVDGKIE